MIYCSCSYFFDEYCGTSLSEGWCADSPKCALDCPICPKSFKIFSASIPDCWNKCQLCPFTQLQSRNEQMLGKVVIVFHPFLQVVLPNRSLEARQPDFAGDAPFCTSPTLDHFSCAKSVAWSTYYQLSKFCLRMSVKAAKNFLEGFGLITSSSASPEDGKEPNIGKKNSFGCKLLEKHQKYTRKKRFFSDPCPCPKKQAQ